VTRFLAEDLDAYSAGAGLYGASGQSHLDGGLQPWVRRLLTAGGGVPLVGARELPADAGCAVICMVGSPSVMLEIPPRGTEPAVVLRELERRLNRPVDAVVAINPTAPTVAWALAAAALHHVPLVDADGQGRLFPRIDQTSFALAGIPSSPLAAVGPTGDVILVEGTGERVESLLRSAVDAAGGWLLSAMYPMSASELGDAGPTGTLSRVLAAGRSLQQLPVHRLAAALAAQLAGRVLGRGRVIDISLPRSLTGPGAPQPSRPLSIQILDEGPPAHLLRLELRNEVVVALSDGAVVGTVPDIICLLDPVRRRSLDVVDVNLGDRVEVLLLPCGPPWNSEAGRRLGGPRAFGVDLDARLPAGELSGRRR
jgi:DUF917 family protein